MRLGDLLGIALASLYQQKTRTLLTMAGVVIGTFALVVCVSLGRGFEREIMHQLHKGALARQVMVWPGSGVRRDDIPPDRLRVRGAMSAAKRRRLEQAIIRRWPAKRRGVQLDPQRVQYLAHLPHVEKVVPFLRKYCQVRFPGRPARTVVAFAANADNQHFRNRIVAGSFFPSDTCRCAVVSEYLLYRWGFAGDEAVAGALGRKLRLEYRPGKQTSRYLVDLLRSSRLDLPRGQRKTLERVVGGLLDLARPSPLGDRQVQLGGLLAAGPCGPLHLLPFVCLKPADLYPPAFSEEFTIVGVLREYVEDRDDNDVFDLGAGVRSWDADVFLPAGTAEALFARASPGGGLSFPAVNLTVDEEKNVKEVAKKIRNLGLHEYSLVEFVQGIRTNLVLIMFVTAFLAAVALLVAALGITNTMIMTVLERTREIGIMKAVGARDGHIQLMFLVEGALIGLLGGCLGVFLGWLASFPGDSVARSLLEDQILPALKNTLFDFPLWLTLGTPLFAALITTLAAVYPARRATRVNPITALRHE